MKNPKPSIVLKSLLAGVPVKIGAREYALCDTSNTAGKDVDLCVVGTNVTKGEPCYMRTHASLGWFIDICEKATEDEIFVIAANMALNKV